MERISRIRSDIGEAVRKVAAPVVIMAGLSAIAGSAAWAIDYAEQDLRPNYLACTSSPVLSPEMDVPGVVNCPVSISAYQRIKKNNDYARRVGPR